MPIVIVTNLFSLDVARALRERRAREGLHGALDLRTEAGHELILASRQRVLIRASRSLGAHGALVCSTATRCDAQIRNDRLSEQSDWKFV